MKTLECKICGTEVANLDSKTTSVVCWECVTDSMKSYDPPAKKKQAAKEGYPKGWRFMKEFVHNDGTVYHKGVEQPDLFGTLSPTQIIVKPKKSKIEKAKEKSDLMAEYSRLKKQLKRETKKTMIKKLESRLKRIQKQIQ